MESSSLDGAFLSPESTVTSLLSSSGHLRSCLEVPEHNTTFRYKYKLYDSASAALNAYIADFNNSHLKEKLLTGNLNASHHFPSTPSRPRVARLKNHDVLREHLTDRELDFLRLPDNSHLQSVNQDRVSMTTDELLSIPYDGSMPVTHTSAFIQGLFSQLLDSQPSASSRPANRSWNRSHSMPTVPELSQQHASPTRSFRSRRPQSPHVVARSDRMEPSSSLHLPHWLTSNNSDMDSSEVSVPRLKYPPWIQCCDVSEPAGASETELWDRHDVPPPDTHPPLCFSSSHCQQDSSEVAAGGTTTPLKVRELQAQPHYSHHGNNLLKQPGPAEALKQVLFRLQAVEAELQHHQQPKASLSPSVDGPLQQEAEPEPRPDGLSLQRALHHLTHLKALVEEPRKEPGKNDKEEVEKDEDEGRYSSLSTDGFRCI
ncbi:lung adenoma susceptibility protein 2 isoform X4 [Takifugu flavidus]|uniref:lung adenoma susceptibility protein 2 isoform X4 n=1 Tax=Takifugu flavidus TaxID=433684 RepID=UPI002544737B|nr:lung adenoma susceptibility protein 2 isoform X4 [Takifugu flavidus]